MFPFIESGRAHFYSNDVSVTTRSSAKMMNANSCSSSDRAAAVRRACTEVAIDTLTGESRVLAVDILYELTPSHDIKKRSKKYEHLPPYLHAITVFFICKNTKKYLKTSPPAPWRKSAQHIFRFSRHFPYTKKHATSIKLGGICSHFLLSFPLQDETKFSAQAHLVIEHRNANPLGRGLWEAWGTKAGLAGPVKPDAPAMAERGFGRCRKAALQTAIETRPRHPPVA